MRVILALTLVVLGVAALACGDSPSPDGGSSVGTSPTQVPTPTPIPDSDNDGLLDTTEQQLGTNPFQRDSDTDGLDDGQEVQLGSDPLFPDTDRDGVVDGDDVLPLANAKVRISILEFVDQTKRGILQGDTNAYFWVIVGNQDPIVTSVYDDVLNQRVAPIVLDVPDNLQNVRIAILAQEHTPLESLFMDAASMILTAVTGFPITIPNNGDAFYDISDIAGTDLGSMALVVDVAAGGELRTVGDGSADGESDDLEAAVTVSVEHGDVP